MAIASELRALSGASVAAPGPWGRLAGRQGQLLVPWPFLPLIQYYMLPDTVQDTIVLPVKQRFRKDKPSLPLSICRSAYRAIVPIMLCPTWLRNAFRRPSPRCALRRRSTVTADVVGDWLAEAFWVAPVPGLGSTGAGTWQALKKTRDPGGLHQRNDVHRHQGKKKGVNNHQTSTSTPSSPSNENVRASPIIGAILARQTV
ncbi:hypothetical protein B7463_g4786, partial [Scytalidium lignicola]